jgi:uncharacterized protein
MMIVLDTNVIVSGILKPHSKSAAILRLIAGGSIRLAYDLRLLSEYRDVLLRPAFNFTLKEVDSFLAQVEEEGLLVSGKPLKVHLPDPDDEPFLELALSANARAIVTGNRRHFPRERCAGMEILSPSEFLDIL